MLRLKTAECIFSDLRIRPKNTLHNDPSPLKGIIMLYFILGCVLVYIGYGLMAKAFEDKK